MTRSILKNIRLALYLASTCSHHLILFSGDRRHKLNSKEKHLGSSTRVISIGILFQPMNRGIVNRILDNWGKIGGARVLLIGSAPSFDSSLDMQSFDLIVSANGSAGQLKKLGVSPHLTFMTSFLLSDRCDERAWQEVKRAIGTAKASHGLVVVRNGFHFERRENFERFDYLPHEVLTLGIGRVRRDLARVTQSRLAGIAPHGLPSMGVIATAYLALGGAKSITMTGFSLTTSTSPDADHFYDSGRKGKNVRPRSHSAADLLILSSLAIRGFDISATEIDLQPALTNGGTAWYEKSLKTMVFWSRFAPW